MPLEVFVIVAPFGLFAIISVLIWIGEVLRKLSEVRSTNAHLDAEVKRLRGLAERMLEEQ